MRIYVGITAVLVVLLVAFSTIGQAPTTAPAEPVHLSGEVVTISLGRYPAFGATVTEPSIRVLGGRSFIVGRTYDTGHPGEWRKGAMIWVPVSQVVQIVEFATVEEYKAAQRHFPWHRQQGAKDTE